MADSEIAADSIKASLENGFDPPDVPSTNVSTETKDQEVNVTGTSEKDAEEKKSVEEMKGVVVEVKGLEDLKGGVDEMDMNEVRDVGNENNLDKNDNVDEMDLASTKDCEEEKAVGALKDLDDSESGEENKDAKINMEAEEKKSIGETIHLEVHNDANDAKDEEENKDAVETNETGEVMDLEGQNDAKEAYEGGKNKDVVRALDGEGEKSLRETKDEKGKKVVEEIKHDEDKIVVEEEMNAEENDVVEVTEDIGVKNNLQASGNVKHDGEKNYVTDVKIPERKQDVEDKNHKDDKVVEKLKSGKNKQVIQGINDDEQKKDLGDENDVKNNAKLEVGDERKKVKKKPKAIDKVEAKAGKKKVAVDEKDAEKVVISDLENEKGKVAEEGQISEDVTKEEDDDGDIEIKSSNKKVAKSFKRKKGRGQRYANKGEVKDKSKANDKKESGKKTKELLNTVVDAASPMGSSRERPVRERKTVERLVEVIEKEPNKAVIIEKGRGTPLKDIPNVAYKFSRKKPADLKFLHQALFGRRGKVVDFKNNILQFSGFAWHEAEEKHRAKIKEKLDKCIKDNLLDLCDLLDLTVSKTNTKKEEIIVKLVDFLEAPHATTDFILSEKEQSEKSKKRKQSAEGSASRSSGGAPAKRSRKKSDKAEGTPKSSGKNPRDPDDEVEEEDRENGVPDDDDDDDDLPGHSESDAKENESSEASDDEGGNDDEEEFGKGKKDVEQSPKKQDLTTAEKRRTGSNSKKFSSETQIKSPVKTPSDKQLKGKRNDTGEKVFTRKKKKGIESPDVSDDDGKNEDADELGKGNQDIKQSPKRQGSSISDKRKRTGSNSKKSSSQTVVKNTVKALPSYKQANVGKDDTGEKVFTRKKIDVDSTKKSNTKSSVKDNSSGKKSSKGKATGEGRKSSPNKTDLRKTICEILKEVDFNTATFTDILKKLATHYKMDLTPKKAAIKLMIQEELTKMADEADDESEDEGDEEEIEKEENPKPASKKLKA